MRWHAGYWFALANDPASGLVALRSLARDSRGDASVHANHEQVPWASQTGTERIVTGARPRNGGAGIYAGNRYTPVPWRASLLTAAW
jgi:hypothetical protein